MMKFDAARRPLEPVTRADLIDEVIRLQHVVEEAIVAMKKFSRVEAEIIELGLERDVEFAQPDVGD